MASRRERRRAAALARQKATPNAFVENIASTTIAFDRAESGSCWETTIPAIDPMPDHKISPEEYDKLSRDLLREAAKPPLSLCPLVCRPVEKADYEKLGALLMQMFEEVGRATLNPQKACVEIVDTCENGACFVVMHGEAMVGAVGINEIPGGLFYSDSRFLIDKFFFIRKEYRPQNLDANAFKLLLGEVQSLVNATGIPCFLRVFNEKRIRARNMVEEIATAFGIYPAGAVLQVSPAQETRH